MARAVITRWFALICCCGANCPRVYSYEQVKCPVAKDINEESELVMPSGKLKEKYEITVSFMSNLSISMTLRKYKAIEVI